MGENDYLHGVVMARVSVTYLPKLRRVNQLLFEVMRLKRRAGAGYPRTGRSVLLVSRKVFVRMDVPSRCRRAAVRQKYRVWLSGLCQIAFQLGSFVLQADQIRFSSRLPGNL